MRKEYLKLALITGRALPLAALFHSFGFNFQPLHGVFFPFFAVISLYVCLPDDLILGWMPYGDMFA